ncbi:MAG: DUF4277 domain-containing protein [Saprospiraceae bacterium]|jgi:hypothetical protein
METTTYTSKILDHLGLIAGICRQIGLADLIDESCPGDSPEQVVVPLRPTTPYAPTTVFRPL